MPSPTRWIAAVALALPLALPAQPAPLANAQQLLVATTRGWNDVAGTLQRYERASTRAPWQKLGTAVPIVVGRNGLGWGRGVNAPVPRGGPVKHEGDGRAPAGVFTLVSAFGYAPADSARWLKLPYRRATSTYECVDDTTSRYYNQTIERATVTPDWRSSEVMRLSSNAYQWGVIVAHNMPARAAAGSCIFLHIWSGPATGTDGCTAMEEPQLLAVMRWLDPARHPLLVQLTDAEYAQRRAEWALP
ncbi:MAG: L,D-transpeptidase family protein [Gemmatimonadaceae bacterium]